MFSNRIAWEGAVVGGGYPTGVDISEYFGFFFDYFGCILKKVSHTMEVRRLNQVFNPFLWACVCDPLSAVWSAVTFFTVWTMLFHFAAYRHPELRDSSLALAVLVSIAGAYLTYVHPKRFVLQIGPSEFIVTDTALRWNDAVMHQLPLCVLLYCYGTAGLRNASPAIALMYAYLVLFSIEEKYGVTKMDIVCVVLVVLVVLTQGCRLRGHIH